MNGVDIGIITLFLFSSILGIWRGLTREALGLISWIGAGLAAYILLPIARHFAQQHITNPIIADVVSVFCIFVVFLIFFSLISHIISSYVKESALGGIDRSLGFGFGIARAIVLVCAAELALSSFMPRNQYPEIMQHARFMPMIQGWSETLLALVPSSLQDFVLKQQLKFVHEHAKKDLENHIQSVLEGEVKKGVEKTVRGTENEPQTIKPADKLDPQKAVESLAKLHVQSHEKEKGSYNKEQQGDLDRLVETVQ